MALRSVAIIGAGPAGLMAADVLAPHMRVDLYEQGRAPGRKFLVAGQGGFNLTNACDGEELQAKYSPQDRMVPVLAGFGSGQLRGWLAELGIPTYVGTSGRVFPMPGTKPIAVLRAVLDRLHQRGVQLHGKARLLGFDAVARPRMDMAGVAVELDADAVVLGLGGASWPTTGSTGAWVRTFADLGVDVLPFRASNCGVELEGLRAVLDMHAGKPLKNIAVQAGELPARGEATLTAQGLEGNAIYPVVPALREALAAGNPAILYLDLKPDLPYARLLERLASATERERIAALHLDRPAQALLKAATRKEVLYDPRALTDAVKALPLRVTALRPLEEAISSVGGVPWSALDADLALHAHPRIFCVGEMVDWDAPTGGYLLQGAFAMGYHAAHRLLARHG